MFFSIVCQIRNGYMAHRTKISVINTGICIDILNILFLENFIRGYVKKEKKKIDVLLKYMKGGSVARSLIVLSKPNYHIYLRARDIKYFYWFNATLILSTKKGVMTGKRAFLLGIGGEVLGVLK